MTKEKVKLRKAEEVANSISHGIGAALAVAGLVLLVVRASRSGTAWHIVSFSVFGVSMVFLYLASSLFHAAKNLRQKRKLNKLDHSAIYILIAGSYTPLSLTSLRGWVGWTIFALIWTLALTGVVYRVKFHHVRRRALFTWLYLAMGWLILIAIVPIIRNVPNTSLWFLLAGCLSYSVSVIFYLIRRVPFFHLVFHLFILGGSVCHFFAFFYLIPRL